jgi:hypothetical protein
MEPEPSRPVGRLPGQNHSQPVTFFQDYHKYLRPKPFTTDHIFSRFLQILDANPVATSQMSPDYYRSGKQNQLQPVFFSSRFLHIFVAKPIATNPIVPRLAILKDKTSYLWHIFLQIFERKTSRNQSHLTLVLHFFKQYIYPKQLIPF